jgi:RNA polymerase sigma factor (sigma-70 family)
MDDREIVAAIAAGDPAGLAGAYDKYAESLYGYCHWMLSDPENAAGAVQDTFVIADGRLGGLSDPRKLRPWLYAVARTECQRRLATGAGPDEPADQADQASVADPADPAGIGADRAELRRLVRAALDGLNSGEREVIELDLGHDLHGADLAAVLGVSRNQAHALASRARSQLEKALGAVVVARGGRQACPVLDMLLEDWDGRLTELTAPMRKRVSRHIGQCDACADRRYGALRPAVLYGMALPPPLPDELREEVLRLCASSSPRAQEYREDVLLDAGSFRPNGFPEAVRPPRQRMLALSGVAAAAGILIAVAATGIITVLALTGSHAPPAEAARPGSPSGTGTGLPAAAPSTGPTGAVSPSALPSTSAPAITSAPPAVTPPSPSPTKARPSPSPSATSSTPVSPTPRPSRSAPTPTATSTATITPTPTVTPTLPL